jgi:hypothetical protein
MSANAAVQTITSPVSIDYCRDWTAERGIAEFVANAIDECPDSWSMSWSNGTLVIEDTGRGVPEEAFVLGFSDKGGDSIGRFGEGRAIGSLSITRSKEVRDLVFDTVGYSMTFRFVSSADLRITGARKATEGGMKMLAYDIVPSERTQGTRISMKCSKALYEKVRVRFLHIDHADKIPAHGTSILLTAPEHQGRVYIGGVFVCEKKKLRFGYSCSLAEKAMQNRDRSVIDAYAMRRMIASTLQNVKDVGTLTEYVKMALAGKLSDDELHFPQRHNMAPREYATWEQVRKNIYGNKLVAWTDATGDLEAALDLSYSERYEILQPPFAAHTFNRLMELLNIPKAKEARSAQAKREAAENRKPPTRYINRAKLTPAQLDNLVRAEVAVTTLYGYEAFGGHEVKIFTKHFESTYSGFKENESFGGFYQPGGAGRISIRQRVLNSFDETLSTLIHEAAHRLRHKVSPHDYSDRTLGFEHQLETMAMIAARACINHGIIDQLAATAPADAAAAEQASVAAGGPAAMVGKLVTDRLNAAGMTTITATVRELRLRQKFAKQMRTGKPASYSGQARGEVEAIAAAVGLPASIVAMATYMRDGSTCSITGNSSWPMKRGAKGQLTYGDSKQAAAIVELLEADGYDGWAQMVADHRTGTIKLEQDAGARAKLGEQIAAELEMCAERPVELTLDAMRARIYGEPQLAVAAATVPAPLTAIYTGQYTAGNTLAELLAADAELASIDGAAA